MRERHVMPFVILTVIVLFLVSMAAHAQSAPINGSSFAPPNNPEHASQHDMAPSQNLYGSGSVTIAQGEEPLWEFGVDPVEPSLGNVARAYREEHVKVEKAKIVWNQQ